MKGQTRESSFKTIHLSYQVAPVEIREIFTFDDGQARDFLSRLRDIFGIPEALLISTCNRTEVYYLHETDPADVVKLLSVFRNVPFETVSQYFSLVEDTESSVRHLLRVGIGLESQVLGDLQIINQVKTAYQITADLDLAGPFLHRLLHGLFFLNKRIVQETAFRSGSASVSYATKELAEDLLTDKNRPVTVLGLGEIGLSVTKNLIEHGFTNIRVCNRSLEKAAGILNDQVRFVPFENWKSCLRDSVLVISALSGDHLQIGPEDIENDGPAGYRYFIDLGMPRSVNAAVENHHNVILYNIDQIQSKVSDALETRKAAVPQVEEILAQGQAEFLEWTKEMQVSPVIQQIKSSLENIRKEEMARFLKKADEEQAAWADELTRNLMQRIMKTHVVQLKAACKRGDAESIVEVLQQLFRVEEKENA